MSSKSVRLFSNRIAISGTTFATGTLTVNTVTNHGLSTGDSVTLFFTNTPQILNGIVTTVTDTQFTMPCPANYNINSGDVYYEYFTTNSITKIGSTIIPLSRSINSQVGSIIHSVLTGTGAVSATITWYGNSSANTTDGVQIGTQILNGTNIDKTALSFSTPWPYVYGVVSPTITGTSAKLVVKLVG